MSLSNKVQNLIYSPPEGRKYEINTCCVNCKTKPKCVCWI